MEMKYTLVAESGGFENRKNISYSPIGKGYLEKGRRCCHYGAKWVLKFEF
jgi:hypothetical protein